MRARSKKQKKRLGGTTPERQKTRKAKLQQKINKIENDEEEIEIVRNEWINSNYSPRIYKRLRALEKKYSKDLVRAEHLENLEEDFDVFTKIENIDAFSKEDKRILKKIYVQLNDRFQKLSRTFNEMRNEEQIDAALSEANEFQAMVEDADVIGLRPYIEQHRNKKALKIEIENYDILPEFLHKNKPILGKKTRRAALEFEQRTQK